MSQLRSFVLQPQLGHNDSNPNSDSTNLRLQSQSYRRRMRVLIPLHIFSLLGCLISIALFSAAIPQWNANFFHATGPNRGDWTDGVPLGPLAFAVLYHAVSLILFFGSWRKTSRSSPPSKRQLYTNLALSFLILLTLFPSLILASHAALFHFWRPADSATLSQSSILTCNIANVFTSKCAPELYHIGSLQLAAIALGFFVCALHVLHVTFTYLWLRRHRLLVQLQRQKLLQFQDPPLHSHPHRHHSRRMKGDAHHSHGNENGNRDSSNDSNRNSNRDSGLIPMYYVHVQHPAPTHSSVSSHRYG